MALVVVGMLIRMIIPLAAVVVVYFQRGPLADAGFVYYVIVFYPVTLSVETFVTLPRRRADGSGSAT
jgi:hypothetical protein